MTELKQLIYLESLYFFMKLYLLHIQTVDLYKYVQ